MKITVLLENTSTREELRCEHGLSLYIETGNKHILFDAGQSDAFADNARSLGIDLGTVDFAVLSHGHYDHGGGLKHFLARNATAPVYLRREAMGAQHNAAKEYIGLAPSLEDTKRLVFCEGTTRIAPGITLHPAAPALQDVDSAGLLVLEDGGYRPDGFLHEQYLLIEENGKRFLFSGCSHRGILNIAEHFRPDVLIGGFHLVKLDLTADRPRLETTARQLLGCPATYYTGHCTGQSQYTFLKSRMGSRLHSLSTGKVIGNL